MARARSFDEDAALDAATDLFWQCGFAGTSVRESGAAIGLGLPSLYKTFGDKHALFARYLDVSIGARIRRLDEAPSPCAAIATILDRIVTHSLTDSRGCWRRP